MRVLIDPGTFDCLNMGDIAMLQAAVDRIRTHEPAAKQYVLTADPIALLRHCPGVDPVPEAGRRTWFSERELLGRLHMILPQPASKRLIRAQRAVRGRIPGMMETILCGRLRVQGQDTYPVTSFLRAIRKADLVLTCGQGTLTDVFPVRANAVLDTLEMGARHGATIALTGQGIGPIQSPALLVRVKAAFSKADFIALREGYSGPRLLQAVGVERERIVVTGDDAVEAAYRARTDALGDGIGFNLRLAPHSNAGQDLIDPIRQALSRVGSRYNAPLLPLPIAIHEASRDCETLRMLLAGYEWGSDVGGRLDTPESLILQAGRCRVVVTGAYHAAVFALSQGVPSVCLTNSRYYLDKFEGLRELFGDGCWIVPLNSPDLSGTLIAAIDAAWECAERLRPSLLEAASRQIALGNKAYADLISLVRRRVRSTRPA